MDRWINDRLSGKERNWEAENAENWDIQMNFNPLRQSAWNWYEFKKDAHLLELHAGYGALTGLFCDRCRQVTALVSTEKEAEVLKKRYAEKQNLLIFSGTFSELQEAFPEKYDYVVAMGELEQASAPAEMMSLWMRALKKEGTLLLSVENRYGLKYFCGAKDPYTNRSYDGINGYLEGAGEHGRCLSRKEILSLLEPQKKHRAFRENQSLPDMTSVDQEKNTGNHDEKELKYRFYYPVPDSRMPQMIFTDDYQKGLNTAERLVDYNYGDTSMFGIEHRMFCEMIDNGALPFLANSYLLEITRQGELSDICYAVTTTDRGPALGMATTIRKSGVVKKRPLWKEGEENLRKLHAYTEQLSERKVPIVQTKLEEDVYGLVMSMPYVDAPGLSSVMKKLAAEKNEKFVKIFDEIYANILRASEQVPVSVPESEKEANQGAILKEAYLDLAPCNCFYLEKQDALLFYDQEFVQKNCPARFAMFRTLKYCYASARDMENYMSLADMYQRYGITEDQLAAFELREKEFLQSVRSTDKYKRIFQLATPDYRKIQTKMKKVSEILSADSQKPYHIGYVPGVFDLFHTGHLILLERCKARCDYLIVGVLTDDLVEYYKGHRTVISYEDRARVIEALKVVDEVIPVDFSNTDKLDAWDQLHYDCHFSGDDHRNHWNPIWEELKRRGSNMEFFPYTQGISSTQIREKMNH